MGRPPSFPLLILSAASLLTASAACLEDADQPVTAALFFFTDCPEPMRFSFHGSIEDQNGTLILTGPMPPRHDPSMRFMFVRSTLRENPFGLAERHTGLSVSGILQFTPEDRTLNVQLLCRSEGYILHYFVGREAFMNAMPPLEGQMAVTNDA